LEDEGANGTAFALGIGMNKSARVLSVGVLIEGATGLALVAVPGVVVWLLFGADLPALGAVVARVAGIALLVLALACWLSRRDRGGAAALTALLAYNILMGAHLAVIAAEGELVGVLIWPAVAVHAAMSVLLAIAWTRRSLASS
jgi:hypothetical protein